MALPSLLPPGHSVAFVPGFAAPTDASLALAWHITGPLATGCDSVLLDCAPFFAAGAVLLQPPPPFYPNLADPLSFPAVVCPTAPPPNNSTALRLFNGTSCGLYRPNNGYACYWNATVQAFVGTGCVVPPSAAANQACLCRHAPTSHPPRRCVRDAASLSLPIA